jgi:hypothetical protein
MKVASTEESPALINGRGTPMRQESGGPSHVYEDLKNQATHYAMITASRRDLASAERR